MTKRQSFSDRFKAAVALEGMAGVLSDKVKKAGIQDGEIKSLYARIGQLAVENDFCRKG